MRSLFVIPSEVASGEAVTALAIAAGMACEGDECRFLASQYAAGFLRDRASAEVTTLGSSRSANERRWDSILRAFQPDVVVFADYPLLFFSSGSASLGKAVGPEALARLDCGLVTLDHLGYAQRARELFFGPPHRLIRYESVPSTPDRMALMLPSPMQAPREVEGRRGTSFRCIDETEVGLPADAAALARTRRRYLGSEEGHLVVLPASSWGLRFAARLELPHYRYLPSLIRSYLRDVTRPVAILGVGWPPHAFASDDPGEGRVLGEGREGARVRFLRIPSLPPDEFARLVAAADLFITDNAISSSLGRAVCARTPSIALQNSLRLPEALEVDDDEARAVVARMERESPGAVFPWSVFPIWSERELDELGILRGNGVTRGFERLELYGGKETRTRIRRLLEDDDARSALRARQAAYAERVARLPTGYEALRSCASSSAPSAGASAPGTGSSERSAEASAPRAGPSARCG